jgi:copper chaperone
MNHEQETTMSTIAFTVPGMTCGHCEAAVKGEIGKLAGVSNVDVNLDTKAVVVEGEGLDTDAIFAAVDEAGFEAVA